MGYQCCKHCHMFSSLSITQRCLVERLGNAGIHAHKWTHMKRMKIQALKRDCWQVVRRWMNATVLNSSCL